MNKRKSYEPSSANEGRLKIPSFYYFDYHTRPPTNGRSPEQLILLLHGFSQTGKKMLASLQNVLPEDALVISPNGPFPLPYRHEGIFKVAFSWYFYDLHKQEYFIDMEIACQVLQDAVTDLKLENLPKQIIGFSQGGFLAPFVGLTLSNVNNVIGIGCDYLVDELAHRLDQMGQSEIPFSFHGIHGLADEIIPPDGPRKHFQNLKKLVHAGTYTELNQTKHVIDKRVQATVSSLTQK